MSRNGTRLVLPGEIGFDVGYHYPRGTVAMEMGYTFGLGYISPNPLKNITPEQSWEWYDAGLAQWLIWEVNAGRTNLGGAAGTIDGIQAANMVMTRDYPSTVAVIAANDTDTTPANIAAQTAYMENFHRACAPMGEYDDTDLAAATKHIPWTIGWLPNAYGWSARQRDLAIQKARALGYHMIQGRMIDTEPSYATIDGIQVDIDHCIASCLAWGLPTKEEPMTPYVFQLASGGFGIRHEAGSRSLNDGELAGPLKGETVYQIPEGSNWEAWVTSELDKYVRDLSPTPTTPTPPVHVPSMVVTRTAPEEWLIEPS